MASSDSTYAEKAYNIVARNSVDPQTFTFHLSESASFTVRCVVLGGEPWFVAADVCSALGISDTRQATDRLDDDERGGCAIPTPGGEQIVRSINESGLYSLILGSRKPEAKPFKRWVTSEVLPAIRKTGQYVSGQQTAPALPQTFAQALRALADKTEEAERKAAALALAAPKVAVLERLTGISSSRSLRDTARVLKVRERLLIDQLLQHGWILRAPDYVDSAGNICTGRLSAAAEARARGYVEVDVVEAGGKARDAVRITPKGVTRLGELWPKWEKKAAQDGEVAA